MSNKDNVFITVNEEISSIIQQYIIREKVFSEEFIEMLKQEISKI